MSKAFPCSLKAKHLSETPSKPNLQAMRDAPVLILVTGKWAVHVSVEGYMQHRGCLERLPVTLYKESQDLPEADLADCSEVGKDYKVLSYHSTLATYEQGESHDWALASVVPMLSDLVILPKRLDERNLRAVVSSFARATRKCLSDSLILAGCGEWVNRCREVERG